MSAESESHLPLVPTNKKQFDTLEKKTKTLLLYYTLDETNNTIRFDQSNDSRLLQMFERSPFSFKNSVDLALYESLVSRPHYELRAHTAQSTLREMFSADLSSDALGNFVAFVFSRATQTTPKRRESPFNNNVDGVGTPSPPELVLFEKYSHVPHIIAQPAVFQEQSRNATVGVVGMVVKEMP